MAAYVAEVAEHWRGRVTQWDVVNEPITAKGALQDELMAGKLGEGFIDIAFHAAREADPDALLVLNASLIAQDEWWEDHQQATTLALLERLVSRGVPVQALGYEAHVRTDRGFTEAKWRHFLDRITDLGLKIMITELDVDDGKTAGDPERRDAEAAALVTRLLDTTLDYQNCLGLLTWGPVDRYSWLRKIPDRARMDGAPLRPTPRDDRYRRKPMWHAIANAIDRAAPRRSAG
jgi:endo-1,4-beta-xylanase